MDDDLFVIPSDNILIGESDGVFVGGDQDLLSESESIVGPPGPQGPAGKDGKDGVDGQSATVTVGSTTTTGPSTDAIVTNVGTNLNAILNFSIPRGAVGETGPAGADGTDGVDGTDGFSPIATVTQTEYGASISITDANGTTTADVVNGSQGPQGPTGPQGPQGPTGATGATGPQGPQGPSGADGNDGFSPIATVTQNTGSATISITDVNGTTTATVYDGTPGTVPNDGTLTIQQNGVNVQTFTANQSTNVTANITVPTGTWGNSSYFDIGDIRVCWGFGTTNAAQTPLNVTFPASFSVAPRVTATANFYEAGGATWSVFVSNITTSGFDIQGGYNTFTGGGGYYSTGFDYIAIGKK